MYQLSNDMAASEIIILDGPGQYLFSKSVFNMGAYAEVQLRNGAVCSNISWSFGTLTTGASCIVIGNIRAVTVVTFGASSRIEGSVHAPTVTRGAGTTIVPCGYIRSASEAADISAYEYFAGSYVLEGVMAAGEVMILNGPGDYEFDGGVFSMGALAQIRLINGARCDHIKWTLSTFTSGAGAIMIGNLVVGSVATLGAGSVLQGSVQAVTISRGGASIVEPCALIPLPVSLPPSSVQVPPPEQRPVPVDSSPSKPVLPDIMQSDTAEVCSWY
jgi:hypothetical protein